MDPARRDAIDVDAEGSKLCRKAFYHADESAFGGGIVGVAGFAALASGGADQHDVCPALLPLHLRHGVLHQGEDAVEVYGYGLVPLLVGHGVDGDVFRRPDTVVADQDIERSEAIDRGLDEPIGIGCSGQIRLHRMANMGSALGNEVFGLRFRLQVVEDDPGSGTNEQANRRRTYSTGPASDECYPALE